MIVGASVLQLPGIKKAKEMGLYVGVVDYNPMAVGIKYADEYFNASTMDEIAVMNAAQIFHPDGIMTLATDMPMRGVAKVAERLGLPGITYETALRATDKYKMIKAFKAHKIPSPWYYVVDSREKVKEIESLLQYPCIMKPTDNAGSHGVALANNFEELMANYDYCHASSRGGMVIVEEYLRGDEISVEVMVVEGSVRIIQITDKLTTGSPHFVEMGHSQPTHLSPTIQDAVRDIATRACQAIGINQGPAHVEMMITERGPMMIELGARMGGDNITTSLVPLSTGVDMLKATIDLALGVKPCIIQNVRKGAAIRYIAAPIGRISAISGLQEAKNLKGVQEIIITKNVGDYSTPICCSNDRIGFVIAQSSSATDALKICDDAIQCISIEIER